MYLGIYTDDELYKIYQCIMSPPLWFRPGVKNRKDGRFEIFEGFGFASIACILKQTQFPCSSLDWSIMGFSQLFLNFVGEKKEQICHVSILVSNFISLEQTLLIINGYPSIHTKTNRKQQEQTPQMKKYQTSRANRYQQKKKNKQGPILPKLLYPILLY